MGMYDKFVNRYPVQKTLRFELIPQGKTLEYIERDGLIAEDMERDAAYKEVKRIIDDYHRVHIQTSLENVGLEGIDEYEQLYLSKNRNDDDLEKAAQKLREQVVVFLTTPKDKFDRLFKKELIEQDLPAWVNNERDKELLTQFNRFTTYFKGFHENRRNMYANDTKSTSIAYRVIDQNLAKYIENFQAFKNAFSNSELEKIFSSIEKELEDLLGGKGLFDFFSTDNYCSFLTQRGIDLYNAVIGGRTESERIKTQGVNEIINLYNQKHKDGRLGLLKPLYKQILSERKSLSFVQEQFENDNDVLKSISLLKDDVSDVIASLFGIFAEIDNYDLERVYVSNDGALEELSKSLYGDWRYIRTKLQEEYDAKNAGKKVTDYEKYQEKRDKEIKKNKSFSVKYILGLCGDNQLIEYCKNGFVASVKEENKDKDIPIEKRIEENWDRLKNFLCQDYPSDRNLANDKDAVYAIKEYLDALKTLQRLVKPFCGSGKEADKDSVFYGEFAKAWDDLDLLTPLYNKVRNYLTRKPYSTEKIKLNFGNPNLLGGWPVKREMANSCIILKDDFYFYLGIMDKSSRKDFHEYPNPIGDEDIIEKMEYRQAADPQKDVQNLMVIEGKTVKKNGRKDNSGNNTVLEELKNRYLPSNINRIRKAKSYSKQSENFSKEDLVKFIDYYKERVIEYFEGYSFVFKDSEDYSDFGAFTDDVNSQAYQIRFIEVSKSYIDEMVEKGKLYLFKIHNKDFSPNSKGTPNLHTLYWKMLFDERNLSDVVYKLNGEAEIFYRKASIKPEDTIVHKANIPIENKNKQNTKKESTFGYDIVKDRRYTVNKFQFHVPVTMNFKAHGNEYIDMDVRNAIKNEDDVHVIGIDRGERNLLYLCVIDSKGNIVEQKSLNQIVTEHNGNTYATDYHQLLDDREKKRDEERKNWQSIETIKELKEGYLSIVIHEIVKLAIKYNAIIVLEDLNLGFMRGRQKVEKQVYQKFEHMLINKLNYLVDKDLEPDELGGLLNAYQLTGKFESFKKLGKQSGILFYTQAWNTSKIDPTTGFVNLFDTRYKSIDAARLFWNCFNSIVYKHDHNMFAFDFNYSKFTQKAEGARDHWIVYTNGERIESKRGHSGQWEQNSINLTEEIKKLFDENGINYDNGDTINQIVAVETKDFHARLLYLLKLTLQMRNSKINTDEDYIISPVLNSHGDFYDSRNAGDDLPKDADANGAYNIARKGLMMVERIKASSDDLKADLVIKNRDWLKYAQGME